MKKIVMCLTMMIGLKGIAAFACDCAPPSTVREAYNGSAVVYTAYVQSISTQPDPYFHGTDRLVVKTLVRQNWKGLSSQSEAIIYTAKDTSMCGYDFRVGQTYLIYGYVGEGGLLKTSYCERTKPISEASAEIEELKRITGQVSASDFEQQFICADDQIEFQIVTKWPDSVGVAVVKGSAVDTWFLSPETSVSMSCGRTGGSDTPPWWICHKNLSDEKSIRASFWKHSSRIGARISLMKNEEIVEAYQLQCFEVEPTP